MNKEQKQNMVAKIWSTIKKRDQIRQLLFDNRDHFNPNAQVLMKELAKFCYLGRTTTKVGKISGRIDPIASAIAEGRREVLLRILELLSFSDAHAVKMIEQLNQQPED